VFGTIHIRPQIIQLWDVVSNLSSIVGKQRKHRSQRAIKLATPVCEMAACLGLIFRRCKHLANKQSLVPVNVFTRDARKHVVSLFYVVWVLWFASNIAIILFRLHLRTVLSIFWGGTGVTRLAAWKLFHSSFCWKTMYVIVIV